MTEGKITTPPEIEVLGTLSKEELALLNNQNNNINQITFKLGNLEIIKAGMIKDVRDIQHSLKVQEEKIIKRYGEKAVINLQTGDISGPPFKQSFKETLKQQFLGKD